MSSKYTQAFDSLGADDEIKLKRAEQILSFETAVDEITVPNGTASAVKVKGSLFAGRRGVALIMAAVMLIAALSLGLFFGLNKKSKYNNIYDLMKNVKMVNEDFIGFSLGSAKNKTAEQKNKSVTSSVAYAETRADNNDTNGLVAITEDLEAEEVRFKKPESAEEVTYEDINQFGAITQFFVMNNLLFIEITAHEALTSNEVKEENYFTLGNGCAVFVVDLDSKNVYSVIDAFKETELWDNDRDMFLDYRAVIYFDLQHGLLTTNPGIATVHSGTYVIDLHDNKLNLKKVTEMYDGFFSGEYPGEYLQDKYKNIYLIEDTYHHPDLSLYNFENIDLLACDNLKYEYFMSTDKQVYRALKHNFKVEYERQYYTDIESLQADKEWHKEASSSDKILRNQLPYSIYSQGGDWMLKDGKIVHIFDYSPADCCYNVDGKIIAHIKNDEEEAILYLCDEDQITADFKYIDIINYGYEGYEKVISYTTNSRSYVYKIQVGRSGHILSEYTVVIGVDIQSKRYKITVNDGSIELVPIEPIYNGFEIVSDIIFLS